MHNAFRTFHPAAIEDPLASRVDSVMALVTAELDAWPDSLVSYRSFWERFGRLQAVLGDGHLRLSPTPSDAEEARLDSHYYFLPIVQTEGGEIVFNGTVAGVVAGEICCGDELVAINGQSTEALLEELMPFADPAEHDFAGARRASAVFWLMKLYTQYKASPDSITLSVRKGGEELSFTVKATNYAGERYRYKDFKRERRAFQEKMISLEPSSEEGIYVLAAHTFDLSYFSNVDADLMLKRIFSELRKVGAEGLIIDMRGNTGGSLDFAEELFSYLAPAPFYSFDRYLDINPEALKDPVIGDNFYTQFERIDMRAGRPRPRRAAFPVATAPERLRFHGEVCLIVNEVSFSAATTVANMLQQTGRGKVVGQTTAGSAERSYAVYTLSLVLGDPGELILDVPLFRLDLTGAAEGNLRPDIAVPRLREDFTAGRDAPLEAALTHLRKVLAERKN